MDDSFESPTATPSVKPSNDETQEDDQSSGDEEGGLDWSKVPTGLQYRPVIPKRGEKEFEPAPGGGSGLQLHVLDRARCAMFDVLKSTRTTSSKTISYGIWSPTIARVHVTVARGIHFSNMGHSVPRETPRTKGQPEKKLQKRLELLPEEAVYLIERGALYCSKEGYLTVESEEGAEGEGLGSPMSVQQAYAEMVGTAGLTLEKYQVYAYLKRLGYVVTRSNSLSSFYPSPQARLATVVSSSYTTLFWKLFSLLPTWFSKFKRAFAPGIDWWRPVQISSQVERPRFYSSLFSSMRFLRIGHHLPLPTSEKQKAQLKSSPYRVFFNVYKPSTPFRKTEPPQPDFQLVVVDAQATPMPSIHELDALFGDAPVLPPPVPRRKRLLPNSGAPTTIAPAPDVATNSENLNTRQPFLRRFFPWFLSSNPSQSPTPPQQHTHQKTNPFMMLKAGRKQVIVAAVDSGNISFFRFGEGVFENWPMV